MVRILLFIIFGLYLPEALGQFATAELSRKKVVVEQPIRVKITAYSPTWFAEPLSFSNLQINGAFIQPFSKTVPGIKYVNNKKYATLEFFYILFPYKEGELVFPELTLATSIPKEGEYKGTPVSLKTKAIMIQVDPVPSNADQAHWIVANNISISNQWSADLKSVKVGDVLERTITIRAAGTLPSFIDGVEIGEADFASIYTSEPEFIDDRDDKNVNGRRIDKYSYLIEKTGAFTIPEVQVTWWNPSSGKYFSRKLPAYEISVDESADMSSLQHLKDSLNSLNQMQLAEEEVELGMDYTFWVKLLLGLFIVYKIARLIFKILLVKKFIKSAKEKRRIKRLKYLESEKYWFDQLNKEKEGKSLLSSLYRWYDRLPFNLETRTIRTIAENDKELDNEINELQKDVFSSRQKGNYRIEKIKKRVKHWRKEVKHRKAQHSSEHLLQDLNP